MSELRSRGTPGAVWSLGLGLARCPRCQRRMLGGQAMARCGGLLEQIAGERGSQFVAKEVMPDHVDVFVGVGPSDAPAMVLRAFKGRCARVLRREFPNLRRSGKVLRSSNYAAWLGNVWEPTVRHYIGHQLDAVAS